MSRFFICLFVTYVSLQVVSAQENSCIVTVHAKHTAYNITMMPNVSGLEYCTYTWANASNYVIANNLDILPELVRSNSVDNLVTFECMNHTILSLNCFPQDSFTIHCLGDCSVRARLQKDEGPQTETSRPWIYVIVVAIIILVLMVLCFLFYKYRDNVYRTCSHLSKYTPGKRSSVDQAMV